MHSGVVQNAKRANFMSITPDIDAQDEAGADLERILGDKWLFDLRAPQAFGGPSSPTLYRALNAGLLPVVKNGNRTMLTRATMKKILLKGLGAIPWKKP
jgi:hypothetical protein